MAQHLPRRVPEDPPPDERTVVGVFDTREEGEAAVAELRARGWSAENIGLVHKSVGAAPNVPADDTRAEEGFAAGAAVGGALGGAAGLAIGLTSLAIPGLGALVAAGPLAAALAGAATGAGMGGLVGSFAGLGIPEDAAKEYEAAVRQGGYFVSISAPDSEQADDLARLLAERGARAVQSYDPSL